MGTYLSTPVTEKSHEWGQAMDCAESPVAWGICDMQGWRKSMEDAHVAVAQVGLQQHHPDDTSNQAKVFAVFDGHGGPEVARFCQLYLVSVLVQQPTWSQQAQSNNNNHKSQQKNPHVSAVGMALKATFHALDRMIDHPLHRYVECCVFVCLCCAYMVWDMLAGLAERVFWRFGVGFLLLSLCWLVVLGSNSSVVRHTSLTLLFLLFRFRLLIFDSPLGPFRFLLALLLVVIVAGWLVDCVPVWRYCCCGSLELVLVVCVMPFVVVVVGLCVFCAGNSWLFSCYGDDGDAL